MCNGDLLCKCDYNGKSVQYGNIRVAPLEEQVLRVMIC